MGCTCIKSKGSTIQIQIKGEFKLSEQIKQTITMYRQHFYFKLSTQKKYNVHMYLFKFKITR